MEEKISIVMTSYNYAEYIGEAIQSVINQTFKNWELIIFDDGSTDDSVEIIKNYCKNDSRIRFFQHENGVNKGLPETVKQALKQTSSKWIVFLESDDSLTSDYLEEKIKITKKYSEVGFIFNDVNIFGNIAIANEYEKLYAEQLRPLLVQLDHPIKMLKLFKTKPDINFIPTFSTVMINKEYLEIIDFNTPIKQYLDWYLWLQIVNKSQCLFFFVNKKLTNWRRHNRSYVNCTLSKNERLKFGIKKALLLHTPLKIFILLIKYAILSIKLFLKNNFIQK